MPQLFFDNLLTNTTLPNLPSQVSKQLLYQKPL